MEKAGTGNCNVDDFQAGVPQKIDGGSTDAGEKTVLKTPDPIGIEKRYPDWWWGRK